MNFKVGAGVRWHKPDGYVRKYIGLPGKDARYRMGRWKFNNCISATVFEYLVGKGHVGFGEAVILRMEKLIKTPELKDYDSPGLLDVVDKIPHPTAQAIAKIGQAINAASKDLNNFIRDKNVKVCGGYNDFTAEQTDDYVNFALAYWYLNTESGPAYQYLSDNPAAKRRKGVPVFDPYGWGTTK